MHTHITAYRLLSVGRSVRVSSEVVLPLRLPSVADMSRFAISQVAKPNDDSSRVSPAPLHNVYAVGSLRTPVILQRRIHF
jgi:hypothetical protein